MRILIIGAGPAGVTVAETLRLHDDRSDIVMLSSEPYPPYSPPAMVEYFKTGRPVHLWKGEDFPERLGIDCRQGSEAVGVDVEAHTVRLAGGETIRYDRLVIASGGRLYAARLEEFRPGVYNFKSLTAAEELLARVKKGEAHTALIIGAGFIGVEIGLLLKDMGLDVTQLVRSRVMRQMLDPETSEIVLQAIEERGIKTRRGDEADAVAFVGEPRAEAVEVRSGDVVSADLLVAATGLRPNIE
ncbi:MAG: FAD-dependent oxidoreductase, partial [Chloroflexota bacterium]